MSERSNKGVSRRQFLNYCLTGVGGFLAAGTLAPMVKFAIDPALKKAGAAGNKVPVASISEITEEPKSISFKKKIKDAWMGEQETPLTAWVYKQGDQVIALSPVCKHLGCTVNWNGDEKHKNEFFCPCHLGRYEKNGMNIPGTPPMKPLDQYEVEIKDGKVLLGDIKPNTIAGGAS
jgi:menaquinol-cytochrome c reductase iron-sulfur subunit